MQEIRIGDCLDVMRNMDPNSIDCIVTDPPYGLQFMGKDWDHGIPSKHFWEEALRVSKPGTMLLAFGGTRTYHRLTCAIEDAGWEIRDCLMWLYGSGFPKSLNIGKAIDKAKGYEREIIGENPFNNRRPNPPENGFKQGGYKSNITLPASDLAKTFDGYGTALKPAYEPIIMAMKPLEGTYKQNAEKWGVAGINIDECRIEAIDQEKLAKNWDRETVTDIRSGNYGNGVAAGIKLNTQASQGRWPANLLLDEEAAQALDQQSGNLKSGNHNGMMGALRYNGGLAPEFSEERETPAAHPVSSTARKLLRVNEMLGLKGCLLKQKVH
jgi:hypothetical protein